MKVVAYWMSTEKRLNFKIEEFVKHYRYVGGGNSLLLLDLSRPLEDQGPIDVIFHKFIELIVYANNGDPVAKQQMERLRTYLAAHPEVICIDPLEKTFLLMSRKNQIAETVRCCSHPDLDGIAFVPKFCVLQTNDPVKASKCLRDADVSFPILCKPELADGLYSSHEMTLIFNEQSLIDIKTPCVAQTFLNHNAKLNKIYVMGPYTYTCERPSIKNLTAGDYPPIHFHTFDVSKVDCKSYLSTLDESLSEIRIRKPDDQIFMKIAHVLREVTGLDFFGVDVILPNDSDQYAIVDINSLPCYESVPEFCDNLVNIILEKLNMSAE